MMQALGELTVMYPVNGAFYTYVVRFVDPSWYVNPSVCDRSELKAGDLGGLPLDGCVRCQYNTSSGMAQD